MNGNDFVSDIKNGSDLSTFVAPTFASFWRLDSLMWQRADATNIVVTLKMFFGGAEYTLAKLDGTVLRFFVLPDMDLPHPLILPPGAKLLFETSGVSTGKNQVVINWSQV